MRKYRNTKIKTESGEVFDSKKEYERWLELKTLESRGLITNLQRQVKRVLIPAQEAMGRKERAVTYSSDFEYDLVAIGYDFGGQKRESWQHIVEDTKSDITRKDKAYIIKRKLMLERYGISIVEV